MSEVNSARKILESFKIGGSFRCLKDLAKDSGFKRASSLDFKTGLNYLIEKGILKLQQSGWRSEKRGDKNHPKTVILTANIYEVVENELSLDLGSLEKFPEFKMIALKQEPKTAQLPQELIDEYKKCQDCQKTPVVYITDKQIGVCHKHWNKLAKSDYEW